MAAGSIWPSGFRPRSFPTISFALLGGDGLRKEKEVKKKEKGFVYASSLLTIAHERIFTWWEALFVEFPYIRVQIFIHPFPVSVEGLLYSY